MDKGELFSGAEGVFGESHSAVVRNRQQPHSCPQVAA